MVIKFKKSDLKGVSSENFLRSAGYFILSDRRSGKTSFARRIYGDRYPRFHIYLNEKEDEIFFNLHLDQKEVSYRGQSSHSGEYDGRVVEEEASRLKSLL